MPGLQGKTTNITIPDLAAGKVPSIMVSALRIEPGRQLPGASTSARSRPASTPRSPRPVSDKVKIIGEAADRPAIAALKTGQQTAWTGF